jgi:hypothetical protein
MRWRNKKSGAAFIGAANRTWLHGGEERFHLLESFRVELVVNPTAVLSISHDPGVLQNPKVERQSRLGSIESIGELADAPLSFAQQLDYLESGFVGEGVKELDRALGS